ncbi:hypothetical protein BGW80DRAFT_69548 [Lactifluus volemus]|nr:hypothetical protein BGW80DRAFT_69548 [Lactifluus volemus]
MIRRARLRSAGVGIYKPAFPASGHSLDQSHFLVSPPCRTRTTTDTSSNIPSRDSITLLQLLSPATSASLPAGLWWTAWLSATTSTSGGLCSASPAPEEALRVPLLSSKACTLTHISPLVNAPQWDTIIYDRRCWVVFISPYS